MTICRQIEPAIWQYAADFRSPFAGYHSPPELSKKKSIMEANLTWLDSPAPTPSTWTVKKKHVFLGCMRGGIILPINYSSYDLW